MKKLTNKTQIPPCVADEVNFCRGCPGWSFVIKAQKSKTGIWGKLPVHCSVTGTTILPDDKNTKL